MFILRDWGTALAWVSLWGLCYHVPLLRNGAAPYRRALSCKKVLRDSSCYNLFLVKWGHEALHPVPLNLRNKSRTWRSTGYWCVFSDVARKLGLCPQMIRGSGCARTCVCMRVYVPNEESEIVHCYVLAKTGEAYGVTKKTECVYGSINVAKSKADEK